MESDPYKIVGRTLTAIEVSLAKTMDEMKIPRDEIVSFFSRPGRKLNPAFVGEIRSGRLGRDIYPALEHEVKRYISQRLAEGSRLLPQFQCDQFSALRLFPIMEKVFNGQYSFFDSETEIFEYKESLPRDREARLKLVKSISAFANNRGGYIFFGVSDARDVVGLDREDFDEFDWERLTDEVRNYLSPSVSWGRNIMQLAEKWVGVVSVSQADRKPVICVRDYSGILQESAIYYRYVGISGRIKAHDLANLLSERDRLVIDRMKADYFNPEPSSAMRRAARRGSRRSPAP